MLSYVELGWKMDGFYKKHCTYLTVSARDLKLGTQILCLLKMILKLILYAIYVKQRWARIEYGSIIWNWIAPKR